MDSTNCEFEIGSTISSRYKIVELLGIGGMGSVYRVLDSKRGGAQLALKTLKPEFSEDAVYVERFIREVELMNKLDHPNIVRTFDIGTFQGTLFYTMEYIEGISLEDVLEHGPLPLSDIPKLITQICDGLKVIHDADIVHRDLKPGNILLLDDGGVKISDFGVARPKASNLTRKDQRVGSIWYMPPEAWQGLPLGRTADLYALGIVLYEAVAGVLPFEGETPGELMKQHLASTPVAPNRLKPETPEWLNRLILKLMAKRASDRPQSAEEIIQLLGPASKARRPSTSSPKRPRIPTQSLDNWRQDYADTQSVRKKKKKKRYRGAIIAVTSLLFFLMLFSLAYFNII